MALSRTITTPISASPPPSIGPGAIRRIAALPSDIDGRSSFTFLITWTEDHLLDAGFLVTWEEIQSAFEYLFPVTWEESGLAMLFLVTWTEEPIGVDEAYERDPQVIYGLMTKP